jgi:hypothetical protein
MKVRSVDVGRVWDCILCPYVSEEGGDGEGPDSEVSSLLSYTRRYVSFAELGHVCQKRVHSPTFTLIRGWSHDLQLITYHGT